MIVERTYPGLILPQDSDYAQYLTELRRDRRYVTERPLFVGNHPIPQEHESDLDERRFAEMELRVFPPGDGEIWGRLGRQLPIDRIPVPVRIGDDLVIFMRKVSTTELSKLLDVSEHYPTYAITTSNSSTGTRRLWREYQYYPGTSPLVQ